MTTNHTPLTLADRIALAPGDIVTVLADGGHTFSAKVKYAPWQLENRHWLVDLHGLPGGFALERVVRIDRKVQAS